MKFLKRATLIVACISAIYVISSYFLQETPYSFRMWVDASGKLFTVLVLPLLLILWGGAYICKVVEGKIGIKVLLGTIVLGMYLFGGFIGFLGIMFSIHEEYRLTKNLLVVNEGAPLDEVHYVYYRPVAFFLRIPGEFTAEIKAEYLEEKYDRAFVVRQGRLVYDAEYGEYPVAVYRFGTALEDNYVEVLWQKYFTEAYDALGLTREYYVHTGEEGDMGWPYLKLKDEADIEELAEDTSALMQYVMDTTDFFKNHRAVLYFYDEGGEEKLTGFLPFGKISRWDDVQEDYYKYPELVAERIKLEYEDVKEDLAERKSYEEELKEKLEAESNREEPLLETPEIVTFPEEIAAQVIYDKVLKEQGYSYELKHNARGNLYIDLGTRPAGEEGDKNSEGEYHFTLVYDRTSKNGACELFVLYKEYCTRDGNGSITSESTTILDMYAVEMESERVISSGRHTWSDVGSKEYREATGE